MQVHEHRVPRNKGVRSATMALLFTFLFIIASCGDGDPPTEQCTQANGIQCICPTGGLGYTCPESAGSMEACTCVSGDFGPGEDTTSSPPSPADCLAEEKNTCLCEDGSPGLTCPLADGTPGECVCEVTGPTPCIADSDCTLPTPVCGPTALCVECNIDEDCPGVAICQSNSCLGSLCTPGEKTCNGNTVQICNDDGTETENFDCGEGSCIEGECTDCIPGLKACLQGDVVICAEDGAQFEPYEDCTALQDCYGGACLTCFPGQGMCEGSDAYQCNTDGTAWQFAKTCGEGELCISGFCQTLCEGDPKFNTYVGCHYWAVDLDNASPAQQSAFGVVITNTTDKEAAIEIHNDPNGAPVFEATVGPGGIQTFTLPPYNAEGTFLGPRAWRITSTAAIVAYQFNPLTNDLVYSNDASVLFPSNAWGTDYWIMSRYQGSANGIAYRSFLTVVCGEEPADVTVQVSDGPTLAGQGIPSLQAGETLTLSLNPFEVLNIESDADGVDLTGSRVIASNPVGVFGGHEAAITSVECCSDHLEQQMIPTAALGQLYVAIKSGPRGKEKDYWRFLSTQDGTTLLTTPNQGFIPVLDAGQYWEITSSDSFMIQSSNPIMVAQYLASSYEISGTCIDGCADGYACSTPENPAGPDAICTMDAQSCSGEGQGTCTAGHACVTVVVETAQGIPVETKACQRVGDPAMLLAPPVEQFRDQYVFLAPENFLYDYLSVMAPAGAQISLDGGDYLELEPIPGACVVDPDHCWSYAILSLEDGKHAIESLDAVPFGISVYGFDDDVSYGYPGGLALEVLAE